MEFSQFTPDLCMALLALLFTLFLSRIVFLCWFSPATTRCRLQRNGFDGPPPSFPLGNLKKMYEKFDGPKSHGISHDIQSTVFPYFATWRKTFGKVFIYWLGTEPFLYIADPDFLDQVASGVLGRNWGKPNVFRLDRLPMFGNGLVMVEGNEWTHHRNIIARAFSKSNLKTMMGMMEESTTTMIDDWSQRILAAGNSVEIDVEKSIIKNAAEIIARTSFGIVQENGKQVFEKLQTMQIALFRSNRLVGVPFSKLLSPYQTYKAWKLGKEIDKLFLAIIRSRKENPGSSGCEQADLLKFLLDGSNESSRQVKLTSRQLVDECKTFFFGGHETTALALTWTLLLLALYPKWQKLLREEIMEVAGEDSLSSDMLPNLTKMGWVLNEVLRLYSPAPNAQRQAREDMVAGDVVITKGTNIWIDVVGMHHDPDLWGDDVNDFKPERFSESINGGCKHRMGFMPFGFGGRICVGRNLSIMEYKTVLSLVLRKFSLSVSPSYIHSPKIMLSLRPSHGVPLILRHL